MSAVIVILIILLIIIGVLAYLYLDTDVLNSIKPKPNESIQPTCVNAWSNYKVDEDKPTISCLNNWLNYINSNNTSVYITVYKLRELFKGLKLDWVTIRATMIDDETVDNLEEDFNPFRLNVEVKNEQIIEAIDYG